jgi:hypothetical protein
MKIALIPFALLLFSLTATCGFGFGDDLGTPTPPTDYWGWQCADGTPVPSDGGGCLPPSCDNNSTPKESDGGGACLCTDGTTVLSCACEDGGCGGGD